MSLEKTSLSIGYIPLLDCVALLWADAQGYYAEFGLDVELIREASWASLRDRLSYGFLDAAHCLSAMLPAAALEDERNQVRLQTPLVLSINQAFISLRQDICHTLGIQSHDDEAHSALKVVNALNEQQPIHLAYVYPHSIHHYCLKEWLALADAKTAKQTAMLTSPPPFMVKGISEHIFDGFCVGEPWNLQAQLEGHSFIIGSSRNIIPAVADKVLAITDDWAQQHPNTVVALTQAIAKAQTDLHQLEDLTPVWQMLRDYDIIQFACGPQQHVHAYEKISQLIRHLVQPSASPQSQDFEWMLKQMQKWNDVEVSEDQIKHIAAQCVYSFDRTQITI